MARGARVPVRHVRDASSGRRAASGRRRPDRARRRRRAPASRAGRAGRCWSVRRRVAAGSALRVRRLRRRDRDAGRGPADRAVPGVDPELRLFELLVRANVVERVAWPCCCAYASSSTGRAFSKSHGATLMTWKPNSVCTGAETEPTGVAVDRGARKARASCVNCCESVHATRPPTGAGPGVGRLLLGERREVGALRELRLDRVRLRLGRRRGCARRRVPLGQNCAFVLLEELLRAAASVGGARLREASPCTASIRSWRAITVVLERLRERVEDLGVRRRSPRRRSSPPARFFGGDLQVLLARRPGRRTTWFTSDVQPRGRERRC